MPRCDDVCLRTFVPKLGIFTFRSCFGWQCDRAESAQLCSTNIRGKVCNRQLSVFSCQLHTCMVGDATSNLSPPIATEGRKSRSYEDRKVTGKDTYAEEMLTWRLATLEMEMQHGSTGGASVPRGCIQECRLGQS